MIKVDDNQVEHRASFPGGIESFLRLSPEGIIKLVQKVGRPKVGIFVPDGNRRLVLAETDLREGSEAFFTRVACTQTTYGLNTLKVFFGHGLPILFAPLLSHSILGRGPHYHRLTALKTLNIIFTSDEWLEFYDIWNVRVRVYGDLSILNQTDCEPIIQAIERVQQITQIYTKHTLFLGIGGEPWTGRDAANATARFYQKHRREPSVDELIEFIYGQPVPPADFFIMSSKLGGLGAIPALICNGNTHVYYLPVPGVLGLTEKTYRSILYDLLYMRDSATGKYSYPLSPGEREQLHTWYTAHADTVIGLGRKIGSVWVPHSPNRDATA